MRARPHSYPKQVTPAALSQALEGRPHTTTTTTDAAAFAAPAAGVVDVPVRQASPPAAIAIASALTPCTSTANEVLPDGAPAFAAPDVQSPRQRTSSGKVDTRIPWLSIKDGGSVCTLLTCARCAFLEAWPFPRSLFLIGAHPCA